MGFGVLRRGSKKALSRRHFRGPKSVPLPAIQSETWLVHAKVREPHLNPPSSYELSWLFPQEQGREAESSYEPRGSGVVRELSREPAMFQIGLQGEVLTKTHPKSRNAKKKTPRLHELFQKVRANFSLVPCDASQEPNGNCSKNLFR